MDSRVFVYNVVFIDLVSICDSDEVWNKLL